MLQGGHSHKDGDNLQGLSKLGYALVSTGGSAKAIEGTGVDVTKVETLTGFPEMLDGAACHCRPRSFVHLQKCCDATEHLS